MKRPKLIFSLIMVACFFASCSSSKQARTYKKTIDGNWLLQTIVTEKISGKFNAAFFNEADFNCFIGSSWNFNDRNSLGTYTINKNGNECAFIKRNIRWSVYEAAAADPKLLQFKRLDEKYRDIDDGGGFRFTILKLDNNSMQLRSDITFEGKPVSFIYNFVRT